MLAQLKLPIRKDPGGTQAFTVELPSFDKGLRYLEVLMPVPESLPSPVANQIAIRLPCSTAKDMGGSPAWKARHPDAFSVKWIRFSSSTFPTLRRPPSSPSTPSTFPFPPFPVPLPLAPPILRLVHSPPHLPLCRPPKRPYPRHIHKADIRILHLLAPMADCRHPR